MDIARINMATIQNKEHKTLIEMVRKGAEITQTQCGIYIDLQGPVIRLGRFRKGLKSIQNGAVSITCFF
jgi:pyruvate kinase